MSPVPVETQPDLELEIKERVSLRAILPRMLDFIRQSPIARRWAPSLTFAFYAGREFRVALDFEGRTLFSSDQEAEFAAKPRVHLHVKDRDALVGLFHGESVAVRPGHGFWHGVQLMTFQRFSDRFQEFMRSGSYGRGVGRDPFLQATLLLDLTLEAAVIVGRMDPRLGQPWMKKGPAGTALFVLRGGPEQPVRRWVVRAPDGGLSWTRVDPGQPPAVTLSFPDPRGALELMAQRLDSLSGTAMGAVQVRGFVPLADTLNLVFDQIPRYTPPL